MKNKFKGTIVVVIAILMITSGIILAVLNQEESETDPINLTPAQAWEMRMDAWFIDVRSTDDFALGHIMGAVNTPYSDGLFDINIQRMGRDLIIIVYCKTGKTSASVLDTMLNEWGFKEGKVFNLLGGFTRWKAEGYDWVI